MERKSFFISLIIFTILLSFGCLNTGVVKEEESKEDMPQAEEVAEKVAEEVAAEEQSKVFTEANIGTSLEELKEQPGGLFTEDLSLEEELTDEFMITDVRLQAELKELMARSENPVDMQKALLYLLGSPNYTEAIEKLENFTPDYDEPYLPEPERVVEGSENQQSPPDKAIILLDASSSMLLPTGNEIRMDVAKDAVARFAKTVGSQSEVSLVVYGHAGSESDADKELSCNTIEEIYPLGEYDEEKFAQALSSFESRGWTPLAGAISKANEMTQGMEGNITIYIVSDGVETCDGDPIQAAKAFAERHDSHHINIIGFQVDKEAEDQLKKVAEAGNGQYYYAENAEDIHQTIEERWVLPDLTELAWAPAMAPHPYRQADEAKKVDELADIVKNITIKEEERLLEALHYLEAEGIVENEVYAELKDLIRDRRYSIEDAVNDLKYRKRDEVFEIAREIRQEIMEWVDRMKALKAEIEDR